MNALSIRNLTKVYGNGIRALKGVDLDVAEGDFFALLGPNGAGKTTAIGIITSLVTKTAGKVHVFGHDIDTDLNAAKASIGVVPQEINLNTFDRIQNIVVNQAGFYGMSARQARPQAQRVLNEAGTTIILTTHYLEEAENLCRHVAIIDDGEVIQHHPMDEFLRTLKQQNFIVNTRDRVDHVPTLDGCLVHQVKDFELEIAVQRDHDLNDVFYALSDAGIRVISMRNKTNRLEELFFDLTDRSDSDVSPDAAIQPGTEA
jgi:ABC-type multidrug transport system ATPase subunit